MSEEIKKNFFKLKNKLYFATIDNETVIPESDLSIQDENCLYQFDFITQNADKIEVEPGVFTLQSTQSGMRVNPSTLQVNNLLTSVLNTKSILEEANLFFNNLDIYEQLGGELGDQKVRKILMHSDPGCGKTSSISSFALSAIKEDPGTIVFIWPTNTVEASDMNTFLSDQVLYKPECTRLILIAEDIGGAVHEGHGGPRQVDNDLLELLDGVKKKFLLPTLVLATTNYPENLLSALADRPGRFDLILKLEAPSAEERVDLFEFKLKRSLTSEEKKAVLSKKADGFSPAHVREVVVRSLLKKWPLSKAIDEMAAHREQFKNNFEKKNKAVGFMEDDF
jgi:hypothetical protein